MIGCIKKEYKLRKILPFLVINVIMICFVFL